MPVINERIILKCKPEEAFCQISKLEFMDKINPKAGLNTSVIFKNDRIIRYVLNVEGVGSWESERVLIPENNIIVTQRRNPLKPFQYMVIVHAFKEHPQGTCFTYVEEFEVDKENADKEEQIYQDISKKVRPNLEKIADYFNAKK